MKEAEEIIDINAVELPTMLAERAALWWTILLCHPSKEIDKPSVPAVESAWRIPGTFFIEVLFAQSSWKALRV